MKTKLQNLKIRTYGIPELVEEVLGEAERVGYKLKQIEHIPSNAINVFLYTDGSAGYTICDNSAYFNNHENNEAALHDLQQIPGAVTEPETKEINGVQCRRLQDGEIVEGTDYHCFHNNCPGLVSEGLINVANKVIGKSVGLGIHKYYRPIKPKRNFTELEEGRSYRRSNWRAAQMPDNRTDKQRDVDRQYTVEGICNAYESGYGHGLDARALPNPYRKQTTEYHAYKYGYTTAQARKGRE